MLALSYHACNARRSTSSIRAHQSNDPTLSMDMAEAGFLPLSSNLERAHDEWAETSDNLKQDRHACRELMNEAAAGRRSLELHKLAGSIFKSLTSETEPVDVGERQSQHHREPSSDIFLRMSGDNKHNHQPRQQHHNKHDNHLPFDVATRVARRRPTTCCRMSSSKTRLIGKAAAAVSGRSSFAKSSSFKIPSRSSSSLLLAHISHIVIISLILHQSPSNNQAFAWSSSHQQHQQQQQQHESQKHPHRDISRQADQHYTKSDRFGSLMENSDGGAKEVAPHYDDDELSIDGGSIFDRMIFDGAANNGHEQQRRQLADGVSWNSHRALHKRQQHMAEIDCQKLAVFWAFLHTSYPALSSHLFLWATEMDGRSASDEQFLWSKTHGSARSIGHLLDEAERLTAAQQRPHLVPSSQSSSWLQRINSNPAYARLVQHLRSSVNKLHKSTPTTTTTTNTPPSLLSDERAAVGPTGSDGLQADGEQMMVAPTQQHSQQAHYGRVVHYPHEIGNTDNSNGMARTLDKLRVLSQHARQQERQFQHQDNEPDLSDIESNRILSAQQDVDLRHQTHAPRQSDGESVESARNSFVYGKVLLRPQHANDLSGESRRDPLSTLRELAGEQQRQLLGVGGAKMLERPRSEGGHIPDHYGRIIMSPPSSSSENNDKPSTGTNHDNSNQQQYRNNHQTVDEMNRMLDLAQPAHVLTADYSQRSLAGPGSDELSNQQKSHRVAINSDQNDEEEFEGVFHPGPIKEIEVRQLRSIDHNKQQNGRPDVEFVTTRSPETVIASTAKH